MESFDVIVIGLGGMGSSAAYHLASRGLRVLGLERFGPAHSRGSSHGGSRIIRQAYFEDPAYVPLLLRAYELWAELEQDAGLHAGSGRELMTLCGGLMIGREDSRTFAGSRRSAEQWGLPHEVLDAREIRRRFPTLTPRSDEVALFEPRAGLVRPEATVAAHIGLARRHDAELHFDEPVLEWRAGEGGGGGEKVLVWTGAGQYVADRLVVCPGAWAPHLLGDLGVPFEVERQVQYWFEPTGGREAFSVDRHPVYVWEDGSGTQVYGFPVHEGDRAHEGEHTGGAKVAFFRRGTVCSADTIDRTVSAAEVQAISDHLVDRIPSLPGRFLRGVACLYTCTPDQNFVIATHPRHPQVSVACGFSGHGFKFVPVVGEILADLALTGTTAQPIGLFDPERQFGRTSEEVG